MPASAPTRHDIAKLLIAAHRHGVLHKAGAGQIDDQRGEQQHDAEVEQRRQQIGAALLQQGIGAGVALGVVGVDVVNVFLGLLRYQETANSPRIMLNAQDATAQTLTATGSQPSGIAAEEARG